jgi:hypothetical protein
MDTTAPGRLPSLLPLLLALPRAAVVGVPVDLGRACPHAQNDLSAFGPWLRAEGELRHAVIRVPPRVVIDTRALAAPVLEAALPALRLGGAIVVLYSDDRGMLARWGERLLVHDGVGLLWRSSEAVRAGRCLELRVDAEGAEASGWIRVPLGPSEGAEAVLSAVRADGIRVCESRIAYESLKAR